MYGATEKGWCGDLLIFRLNRLFSIASIPYRWYLCFSAGFIWFVLFAISQIDLLAGSDFFFFFFSSILLHSVWSGREGTTHTYKISIIPVRYDGNKTSKTRPHIREKKKKTPEVRLWQVVKRQTIRDRAEEWGRENERQIIIQYFSFSIWLLFAPCHIVNIFIRDDWDWWFPEPCL